MDRDYSIRSISKSNMRKRSFNDTSKVASNTDDRSRFNKKGHDKKRTSVRKKRVVRRLVTLAVGILFLVIILMSTLFASVSVTITPKSEAVAIDGIFEAVLAPLNNGDLKYEILGPVTFESREIIAAPRKERNITRATGTLTVYNANKSGAALDLINRSRFVIDGKTYRLTNPEKIPAGRTINGSFVPGTKNVEVLADEAGSAYNITDIGSRFSIPGLARFEGYADSYAISKTEIVGGFAGERYIADEKDVLSAEKRLRKEIEVKLLSELNKKIDDRSPQKLFIPEESVFIEYKSKPQEQGDKTVTVIEEGVLKAVAFREIEVAKLIYKETNDTSLDYKDDIIELEKESLSIEIEDREDFDPSNSKEFSFRMNGDVVLKWNIDEVILFSDLRGKNKSDALSIIARDYPQIIKVNEVKVSPFWRRSIPKNSSRFELNILDSTFE